MRLQCENNLCIYNKQNMCILDTITLNTIGICNECILLSLDESLLTLLKQFFGNPD